MHEDEKYLDSLYCIQDQIKKDAEEFAKKPENFQGKGVEYFDTLMHMAKNLRKEIWAEEGKYDDMFDEYSPDYSEGNQGYGRAIRTTPGISYERDGSSMRGSMRSMRGMRRSYDGGMGGGNSGKRDARGRYSRSADGGEDLYEKLRRHANMTTDHDDRERMLTMIDWLESEN